MIPYSHTEVCPYFPIDFRFGLLKIKKVYLRLVMGMSANVWSFRLSGSFLVGCGVSTVLQHH
ncbi:hypothetical protein H5410_064128, partial [Solanum commersonii]